MLRKLVVVVSIARRPGFRRVLGDDHPGGRAGERIAIGQANVDNGRAMFLVGGCAACHATPTRTTRPGSAAASG